MAQGQLLNGQIQAATETYQVGAYQTLISLMQHLLGLLLTAGADSIPEIAQRIKSIVQTFALDDLSPATMFSVYLSQAHIYTIQGNQDAALTVLQHYVNLASRDIYPLTLHGDAFFNHIDNWLADLDLGVSAPRADATVKAGIVAAVKQNPLFSSWGENPTYQLLIEKLSLLEE